MWKKKWIGDNYHISIVKVTFLQQQTALRQALAILSSPTRLEIKSCELSPTGLASWSSWEWSWMSTSLACMRLRMGPNRKAGHSPRVWLAHLLVLVGPAYPSAAGTKTPGQLAVQTPCQTHLVWSQASNKQKEILFSCGNAEWNGGTCSPQHVTERCSLQV